MVIIGKTSVEVLVYDCLEKMYVVPTKFRKKLVYDSPKTYLELLALCHSIAMDDYAYIVTLRCADVEPFEDGKYYGIEIDLTQGAYDYPYVSVRRVILNGCWAKAYLIL